MRNYVIPIYDKSIIDYLDKTLGSNCKPNIFLVEDANAYNKFIDDLRDNRYNYPIAFILPNQQVVSNIVDNENYNREKRGIWRVSGNEHEAIVDLKYELCFISKTREAFGMISN